MATILKENERLVCVGQTAARAPNGDFLPAVPVYRIVDVGDMEDFKPAEELTTGEAGLYNDIGAVFGGKFKQYMDGLQAAGVKV